MSVALSTDPTMPHERARNLQGPAGHWLSRRSHRRGRPEAEVPARPNRRTADRRDARGILAPMRSAPAISFARPDAEAVWRPDAALLADARVADFLRHLDAGDLDAVQARAV